MINKYEKGKYHLKIYSFLVLMDFGPFKDDKNSYYEIYEREKTKYFKFNDKRKLIYFSFHFLINKIIIIILVI